MKNYERIYKLVDNIRNISEITIDDINYISKKWKQIYTQFLIDWGYDKKSTKMLFDWEKMVIIG